MKLKFKVTLMLVMLVNISFFAQEAYTLKGVVTSQADNDPLPGVSVRVVSTSNGTETDFDGNYTITITQGNVLEFSYLGFAIQRITIANQKTLNVSLVEDATSLDEIVVVGYGTSKKSHLTGAISKVVNENLDQIAVARVDDALIGQVSGVNIQATNAEAGGAPTIRIRGTGSISSESGPAVVVDGVIVSSDFLGNLDMNDVESFEVLKDAASAAIYGSEGSNGVILITTKSGKEGKTKFSYNTYTGYRQAFESEEYKKSVADWAAREMAATGELSETTQYAQKLVEVTGVDRDWQDVFFDGGIVNSHSFSARGGTEDTKFSTSLRYLHDEGAVITDDYKVYSAKLKVDTKVNENLKFGISATPSYSKRRALPTSIHNPIRQSPWLPIYHTEETLQFINRANNPDVGVGDYFYENHLVELDLDGDGSDSRPRTSGDSNPYAQYVEREHYEFKTKLLASSYLSYQILEGLTAQTRLGVTLESGKRTRWDGTKHHASGAGRASYELRNRFRSRLISDNTLSYDKTIGDHEFNLLAGLTIQQRQSETSTVSGSGYSNDLLKNLQGATVITNEGEVNLKLQKLGYFGRISYAYADKYLFNASFRRDGSSVFGLDTKWGNFPAVSAGWNISKEDFLLDNDVLNNLKLRVSYGLTGNENFDAGDDLTNIWPYLALLKNTNAVVNGTITSGFSPSNISNQLLQWESSEEFNPGVDFGFLNNKITGSVDYYKRTSDKLLLNQDVSYLTGFSTAIVNKGIVENRGWEFELRTKNINTDNFSWNSSIIASTNQNELLDFGQDDGSLTEDTFGRNSQWINKVGNPISSFYGYVVDETKTLNAEYYATPWIPINGKSEKVFVKDLNGDGIITSDDKTILGDPYANLVWSITNEFKVKDFDFSFMIQASHGAEVRNVGDQYFYTHWTGRSTDAQAQAAVNEAIPPAAGVANTDINFLQQRVHTNDIIQSAGYISLRNVNIGYNIPEATFSKLGMDSLRIYATGQNLVYITADDYHGFNPEYIDSGNTPQAYGSQRAGTPQFKTISLGLNINF